jgi:hypothetical protein
MDFLYLFINHFAKLYDSLFFQIWQPTAVRHDGHRAPRQLGTNRRYAQRAHDGCRGARRLDTGHGGLMRPTAVGSYRRDVVGHGGKTLPSWPTAA